MDDRSAYQQWADGISGTPDEEQQTQLSINQETAAPEGTNVIDTSRLSVEDIEGTTPEPTQPAQPEPEEAAPEEPEKSYGEKAVANESVVDKWIGDGLAFVKDAFDDRDYDEIREEITENNIKREDSKNLLQKSISEVEKIGGDAILQPLNAVAQVGKLATDTVGSVLGMREDAPAPWDSAYEGAEFNLVGSRPVSEIGQASATILGFMNNNRILNQVLPGKNASGAQKFARNVGIDAVADMIFSPGKGNLINAAQDTEILGIGKLMRETGFLDALAHKDDDNEFIRRIKNGAEGNVIGRSIDGIGLLYTGFRNSFGRIAGPLMEKKKLSFDQLPGPVKEANQIIFDKITALDEFELKSPEAVEATADYRKAKAKGEVGANSAEYQSTNIDRQAAEVSDELAGLKQKVEADKASKEVEKDALLFKLYKEQTARLDELAKEVKGDADALAAIEEAKLIDQQIQLDLGSYSNSFTAKLKKPRPMGQTELPLDGFKGAGDIDTPISKMEADFKSERRQAWKEKFNKLSEAERKPLYERRPGFDERKAEDIANSGTKEQQLYEANERASKTSSFPVRKVAAQQAVQPEFGSALPRTSTDPIMTDALTKQLDAAGGDTSQIVQKVLPEEFRAEMDEFRATNRRTTPEALNKIEGMRQMVREGKDPIQALHSIADEAGLPMPVIRTIWGDAAGRAIITDIASQIREQVPVYHEIMAKGGDITRQANMLIDQLKAVGKEVIRGRSIKGSALNALRSDMDLDEFIRRAQAGEFDVPTKPDLKNEKKLAEFDRQWEEVRQGVLAGDSKALETMDVLSESLVVSDGNPELIEKFASSVLRMGTQNFRTTMYNAYLSSLRTHERNILGTGFNVAAKPLLAAMGSLATPNSSRSALAMYGSIFGGLSDSFAAARIQWAKTGDAQVARGQLMSNKNMAEQVDNLQRKAKTPGQAAAAMLVRAQYYLLATPGGQYFTRAMASTDAAFRAISARQMAKYDYMMEIGAAGRPFDADELNAQIAEKFTVDMQIDDSTDFGRRALRLSKEDTFQTDMNEFMTKIDDAIKAGGVVTSTIVPFVKTPTSILGQTPQFMPILPRIAKHTDLGGAFMKEYHAVVNGDDELLKAIYKGREGAAYIIGLSASTMALNGVLTGSGHVDYGERKLDELKTPRHSIKIGGKWYSHRVLGPISTVLSMYADAGYVVNNSHRYDDYNEYFGQATYSIAGALFEQSWLKGLVDSVGFLEEVTNGRRTTSPGETFDAIAANTLRAFTKYGGALKDFNNILVPGAREYNSNMERWRAEVIPFAKAFSGAEKISPISGEPIMDYAQARTNVLTPFSIRDVEESKAVDGLVKYGIDYTLELNDHYNGVSLSATTKHEVNKIMANPGKGELNLEDSLIEWFKSTGFQKRYNEWLENPTPKEGMGWYTDTVKLIADLRSYAVNQYKETDSEDARILREKLDTQKEFKAQQKANKAKSAKLAKQRLDELSKF